MRSNWPEKTSLRQLSATVPARAKTPPSPTSRWRPTPVRSRQGRSAERTGSPNTISYCALKKCSARTLFTAEKCANDQVTVQTQTPLILIPNVPNRRESCRFRTVFHPQLKEHYDKNRYQRLWTHWSPRLSSDLRRRPSRQGNRRSGGERPRSRR